MNLRNASRVVVALASVFLIHGVASAASVGAGQFNVASSVYLTNSGFFVGTDATTSGPAANGVVTLFEPNTGQFSDLVPTTNAAMKGLTIPPVVVGGSFTLPQFVVLPDGIDLDLMSLPVSPYAVCTGADSPACQAQAGSPITLSTTTTGVSATFNVSGTSYFASTPSTTTPFRGIFTAQFTAAPDNTIAGLLADFSAHGFITTSFSATFATIPTHVIPEPASMALLGAGLFGLGLFGKRKLVK